MNQYQQEKLNKEKEEKEKPLVEENVNLHQMSTPTVGKKHEWVQQGPHLICKSCESQHGIRIGVHKRLKGFDNQGNMIIENV